MCECDYVMNSASEYYANDDLQGGFPVMAEITPILAVNTRRQLFFVITTTVSTRCFIGNFQQICYSQRVNATSQYDDNSSSSFSKWPNDQMFEVV